MNTNDSPLTILPPFDVEKKVKILIEKFSEQVGVDFWNSLQDIMSAIELVAKDNKVRFFVNAPIFFHDGRIYQVQNYLLDGQFFKTLQIEHNKSKLFAIKTLYTSPLLSSGSRQYLIRGCFILNCDKLISDERDTKLEKLIDVNI